MEDDKSKAVEILPKFLTMIDGDIQEAVANLYKAVSVSIKAESDRKDDIAQMYVELDEYYKTFKAKLRGIYE